jgi:nicotinamide-nucleotide amidase
MPSAEIIAIGTEILLGDIVDTNSQALGRALADNGIDHNRRATVGDHLQPCSAVIKESLERADIVFTIGGLGPTGDDVTRDAIAIAVGEDLVEDDGALATLKEYVKSRGGMWRKAYTRQAMRPASSVCLPNEAGTAPGIHWQENGKHIIAMPGPRNEFLAMLANSVMPILETLSQGVIYSRTIRVLGMPESALAEMFAEEMSGENPTVSPYAKLGEVHLRVTARGPKIQDAAAIVDPVISNMASRVHENVYSTNDEDLSAAAVSLLVRNGESVAVAESCTGGLLGGRLTAVSGASAAFAGGIVSYSDRVKTGALQVNAEDLEKYGAVSKEMAAQMATNVRGLMGATWGLSITGIAGPGGGTEKKPVGLVYIGLDGNETSRVEECHFRGSREHIREASVHRALSLLWRAVK